MLPLWQELYFTVFDIPLFSTTALSLDIKGTFVVFGKKCLDIIWMKHVECCICTQIVFLIKYIIIFIGYNSVSFLLAASIHIYTAHQCTYKNIKMTAAYSVGDAKQYNSDYII